MLLPGASPPPSADATVAAINEVIPPWERRLTPEEIEIARADAQVRLQARLDAFTRSDVRYW